MEAKEQGTIRQTTTGKKALLELVGPIDEGADYTAAKWDGVDEALIDFEGVTLINSTGLQRWIKFLEGIPKGVRLSFARCPVRVVNQLNMFPGFVAGRDVTIESFYASYYCEACDAAHDLLLKTSEDFGPRGAERGRAPVKTCPGCKGELEFDGIEKKYFIFLKAG